MSRRVVLPIAGIVLLAAQAMVAHHAEPLYDMKNPTTVKGVVSRVEWGNPHVYLHLTVNPTEEWVIELTSPNALRRYGWTQETVKPGDMVTCTGGRAKTGARALRAATVETASGKKLKS
jgi:hypothetical protein